MKRVLVLAALLVALVPFAFAAGTDYGKRVDGPNFWMAKFDQPVTIHIVNRPIADTPFLAGDDPTKNEWTRGIKEHLNVDIVTDWLTDSQGYTEKLNLAIASKQLPDVYRANNAQFAQLVQAGLTADLTDYQANNLSTMVMNIMNAAPVVTASAKVNGRLMGLPTYGYGDLWNVYDLWLRNDWLKTTGSARSQEHRGPRKDHGRLHEGSSGCLRHGRLQDPRRGVLAGLGLQRQAQDLDCRTRWFHRLRLGAA